MRIVIIGGTGHIGTYLVPRLVYNGHDVINVSRGARHPYHLNAAWKSVTQAVIDREEAEKRGDFGGQISSFEPDAVIDMICFKPESAVMLVDALRGQVQHFLHCGTIWVHGPSEQVPTDESQSRKPFGQYGVDKAAIETYLLTEARQNGFPATVLHPGHIVGPGWIPLNPAGHFNPDVYRHLARGEPVVLPNIGMETVHHVHADDVAQGFIQALNNWRAAVAENFHIVSPQALTLRGYAEAMAHWFGQEPNLEYLPWDEWRKHASTEDAAATWDHIAHSPNCSIRKAQKLLGYQPRYSSLQAVKESISWLINNEGLLENE
jgi:nucleoside-diphosphate-sugar epimerase